MASLGSASLPYRPCVGVMLINPHARIWLGRRSSVPDEEGSGHWWQMPQGGIDEDEEPVKAAARELYEETGVRSASLLAEAPGWYYYDLPPHLVGVSWKGKYGGQKQRWFAFRFTGDDSEIDIAPEGHKPEFDRWRWAGVDEVAPLVVPFKRKVYEQIIETFRPLLA